MSTTPGPWTLGRTGRPSTLAIFRESPTARELVCTFADHTVAEADARLMAAAPQLLELAKQYASECTACGGTGEIACDHPRWGVEVQECPDCADIRLVIADAEGRS